MIAALPVLGVVLAAGAPPRFSADIQQVRLDVAVSRGGDPVPDLTAGDFEVLDDGARQPVTLVERGEQTVHGVLVLDLSSSLDAGERQAILDAAAAFLRKLEPGDMATLLTFTQDVRLISGPGTPESVLASLSKLEDYGTTALYDAVYAGVTVAGAAPGRPFVLVFTDGLDQISWMTADKLANVVRGLEASVYVVSPEPWPDDKDEPADTAIPREQTGHPYGFGQAWAERGQGPWRRGVAAASREVMDRIVAETGGRRLNGKSADDFADHFTQVLADVKSRYLLVYDAPEGRPGWHEIKVRLKKRKGEVRARRGYFAAR
jgi:VWFA-related protein